MMRFARPTQAAIVTVMLTLLAFAPAAGQTPAQRGNSFSVLISSTAGATSLLVGMTFRVNPTLDAVFAYSTVPSFAASELDAGFRYHFPVTSPVIDPYIGAGLAIAQIGGFGVAGMFLQTGAAFTLASQLRGYGGVSYVSAGGTTALVYDIGAEYLFSRQVRGVVGVTGASGSSSLYFGASLYY
ncbi:MAG: hypothetical protein WD140_05275 [bacterium]